MGPEHTGPFQHPTVQGVRQSAELETSSWSLPKWGECQPRYQAAPGCANKKGIFIGFWQGHAA